jgi:hypothetical protein
MVSRAVFWGATVLSGVAFLLSLVNVTLINNNRRLNMEIGQRQQQINASMTFNQINQSLVQALAAAAVNDKDKKITDLLTSQGITVSAKPAAAASENKQ